MPAVVPSKLSAILSAVRTRLSAAGVVGTDRAYLRARAIGTNPHVALQDERVAVVIPLEQVPDQRLADGGGRRTTVAACRVEVHLRQLHARDESSTDDQLLLAVDGLMDDAHAVESALQEWMPENGGDVIAAEPLRWLRTGAPERGRDAPAYGDIVVSFALMVWKEYPAA